MDVYVRTTVAGSLSVRGAAFGDQVVSKLSEGALGMGGSEDVGGLRPDADVGSPLSARINGVGSWSVVTALARLLKLVVIAIEGFSAFGTIAVSRGWVWSC